MALDTNGYYVSGRPLEVGEIIFPGNWGAIIRHYGNRHQLFAREMHYERERAENFPAKPSRLTSNFIWGRLNDAVWYRRHHHIGDFIYQVLFDQTEAPLHQGVFLCIPPHPSLTLEQLAAHYWAFDHGVYWDQDPSYMPIEIVTASPLRVLPAIDLS